jgi:cardiolipin synthase
MMLTVLGVAAATIVLVVLALNFVPPEKKVQKQVRHFGGVDDPQFLREMGTLLGPPILGGNTVKALQNGDEIFPAMLEAIRGARRTITFETYIYWSGSIGKEFADALVERARAGVRVHVLLDWAGSLKMEDSLLDQMADAGVEIERFHPLHWYHLARLNNRTHRKLLVVDGTVGFTGGVGGADHWLGHAQDPEHWRDSHFRFEGPVVAQAQSVFNDNWIKATGEVLRGDGYFPAIRETGEAPAQLFSSSPSGGSDSMHLMYLMAIAAAERSIDLAASYFVPDQLVIDALLHARHRGIEVRVIVPGEHIDSDTVRHASRRSWGPLLEAGVRIATFEPAMFHCKVLIVDQWLVSVGSTNFDNRSFRLNAEASLNVYDRGLAVALTETFEADLARCREVTFAEWTRRPLLDRIREIIVVPLRSQL